MRRPDPAASALSVVFYLASVEFVYLRFPATLLTIDDHGRLEARLLTENMWVRVLSACDANDAGNELVGALWNTPIPSRFTGFRHGDHLTFARSEVLDIRLRDDIPHE